MRVIGSMIFLGIVGVSFALFFLESHRTVAAVIPAQAPSVLKQEQPLRVWFFDVGQGDAILIEAPNGYQLLIDGGPDADVLSKLGSVMAPWDRTIDAVLLTHPHADHARGLISVLETYRVGAVYESGATADTGVMRALRDAFASEGAEHVLVDAAEHWESGGVSFDVLWPSIAVPNADPEDPNEMSIVLSVRYGDASLLLTGDALAQDESTFGALSGDVDVLKIGHHGSASSTSEALLDLISPETAVISVGQDNRYDHPHPATIRRLSEHAIRILRTDIDGDVLLTSDGGEPVIAPAPLPF